MAISETRLRTLLRQAEKVAANGKRAAALSLYQQVLEEAPQAEAAWLGVAELAATPAEREAAYLRVLALNADNRQAQLGLAHLRGEPIPNLPAAETSATVVMPAPVEMPASMELPETKILADTDDPFDQARAWLEEATRPMAEREAAALETTTPEIVTAPPEATLLKHPPAPPKPEGHDHTHTQDVAEEAYELVCYRHPDRGTSLRCYTCNKPICGSCAVKTPVGYRCPDCIREAEDVFFNAKPLDYVIAPLVALPISLLAGFLLLQIGGGFFFILIILFVGGLVGGFIGRMAKSAVGRRRGRYLPHVVAAMVVLGGLVAVFPVLLALLFGNFGGIIGLLVPGIYMFVAGSAAFYQMK